MTRAELKTLKAGDIVYARKTGIKYEFIRKCKINTSFGFRGYDLLLKPFDGSDNIYLNSKKVRR